MLSLRFFRPLHGNVVGIAVATLLSVLFSIAPCAARQQADKAEIQSLEEQISQHVLSGEFPRVQDLIERLPTDRQDAARATLFRQQMHAGATRGAANTALGFNDDQFRNAELYRLKQQFGSDSPSQAPDGRNPGATFGGNNGWSGGQGGITENDFQPLMDLITGTISPDRWEDQDGPNSLRPYPSGVYVDHTATLRRLKVDPSRFSRLLDNKSSSAAFKHTWFEDSGNRDAHWNSGLRKVSLNRLERAAELQFALGLPFDDEILNMAGLTDVQYVFVDREKGEIVVAGPAGPWKYDSVGRAVNANSGRPVLQLEDFVVLLRNAFYDSGKFGCTIDPRAKNLAAVQELLETRRSGGGAWKKKLRETMGQQDIVVFGLDPRTHAARVLVEADHHMKLVGMGLEPSITEVPSYLDRLSYNPDSSSQPSDVVRWWFTARPFDLACDKALECFELTGSGVQVLSESELLGEAGSRIHTGRSTGPTQGFARDFSKHFLKMAARYPVYYELQNIFTLGLVANLIEQHDLDQRSHRGLEFLKGPSRNSAAAMSYPVRMSPAPKQVDSVMNERVFQHRKANSTVRNTVIAVSGGVEFDAASTLASDRLKKVDKQSLQSVKSVRELEKQVWWWD